RRSTPDPSPTTHLRARAGAGARSHPPPVFACNPVVAQRRRNHEAFQEVLAQRGSHTDAGNDSNACADGGRCGRGAGRLWRAGDSGAPRWVQPLVYAVFEPDGRYLGAVELPRNASLRYPRGDHVWAITRDESDVQDGTRFRIQTGEPIREGRGRRASARSALLAGSAKRLPPAPRRTELALTSPCRINEARGEGSAWRRTFRASGSRSWPLRASSRSSSPSRARRWSRRARTPS